MWVSNSTKIGQVRWGRSPTNLIQFADATRSTYSIQDMCEFPANISLLNFEWGIYRHIMFWDPGQIHDAVMKDLKPDTLYYYQLIV
jgi:hypothetical protein